MSFAKGSSIDVLEKQDEWWRGRLKDGTSGWFPRNYVQSDVPIKKKEAKRAAPKPPGAKAPEPVKPAEPEPVAPAVTFIAAFDFQGEQATDLSFATGDKVHVSKQEGEWWEGKTDDGRTGIFPASFVEPMPNPVSFIFSFLTYRRKWL